MLEHKCFFSMCGKTFSTTGFLNIHLKTAVHIVEKGVLVRVMYKCEMCGVKFYDKEEHEEHMTGCRKNFS